MQPQITIVMATYNGARYLPAQLDSILAQSETKWRLLISDDGSTDQTCEIIESYSRTRAQGRMQLIEGPRRGSTANFLHLIAQTDPTNAIAFSDQDDIWRPDKLERAVSYLSEKDGPAVYAARTTVCDEEMQPLSPAPHFPGPFGFRNALIQACLPGNTTVANPKALALLQQAAAAADRAGIFSHDWWVYQLLSGAGAAIKRDEAQVLLYRQHGGNLMGRNDTAKARAARFSMLFDGTFANWLVCNQAALAPVDHLLTPENRVLLQRFGGLLQASGPAALTKMLSMRLYRQTSSGTAAVLAAALAGRLRKV